MRQLWYITHGDVVIDPEIAVPDWCLSPRGRARHAAFASRISGIDAVFCSHERKARDGAGILAQALGLVVQIRAGLQENDRSATGYLPSEAFEAMADAFFAAPDRSVSGWERAVDAQQRIVAAVRAVVAETRGGGDIAIVAHGGVGALLRAHVLGAPISRLHDQPAGKGGHLMRIALPDWRLVQDWTLIEEA